MYCVIVLFVLLSAPLMGMMVEMHGAPEWKDGGEVLAGSGERRKKLCQLKSMPQPLL